MDRFLLFFGMIGLLLACKPITAPTPTRGAVPFETLALNESGAGVDDTLVTKETQLLLIQDGEQAGALESMISAEDFMRLQSVDYETSAVIALFRGLQVSSNYQTAVQQISNEGHRLVIKADLWAPNTDYYLSATVITYPYHLITIARKDLPSASISLQLEAIMLTPTPPAK